MSKLRRFFTAALMVMVVLGMSAFVAPEASAAAQAGDLIKMDGLSSVYYLGADGKRYVFPNEATYFSWYQDFSGVVTISATELQSYPLGPNITIRPGTYLVKITTDPKVYAVEPGGHLRWIQTEEDAIELYGENWASKVVDVADGFFNNYTIADPLESGEYPAGQLLSGSPIYYWDGEEFRWFASEAAFVANGFNFDFVVSNPDLDKEPRGDDITGQEDFSKIDFNVDPEGPPSGGSGLSVALNSATPISQSIPSTVSRVPFTKVNFTASHDGSINLESLVVTRTGLTTIGSGGSVRVWAEHNGVAVSSKRTLNNDEAILTLSPAVNISAGQTVTLDIIAELKNVEGNMALGIASTSAVSAAGATVTGPFPINGNLMSLTSYTVTKLELDPNLSTYPVTIGDTEVELGRFNVNFSGTEKRDVVFHSLTLRNVGVEDLSKVVMDMYLEYAGEKVSEYAVFTDRHAYFLVDMEMLRDDGDKTFIIKGDIIDKESTGSNSLDLRLQRDDHLEAYESSTGFGVTYGHGSNLEISVIEIQSGVVSLSKKVNSPSDGNVVKGSNNQVALLANIKVDEAIYAEGLKVYYNGDEDAFRNVKVYLNNILLDSFDLTTGATYSTENHYTIDNSIDLSKGDNEVKITVDVRSAATSGKKFKAQLKSGGDLLSLPEYVSSGIFVDVAEITGSAIGAELNVEGGTLTVTRNDGYENNRKVVQGNTDVSLGKFAVRANNDNLRVTSIALGPNDGATTKTPDASIYDMKLFVDGTQVGNTRNFTSGGATFSSLNYDIPENTIKVFELKGSFDSSAAGASGTYFKTELTVNAQDSTGSAISPAGTAETTQFHIIEGGSLTLSVGDNTPDSAILIAGLSIDQELAHFRFDATDDSIDITEIEIVNWDTGGSTTTSDFDSRISAYKLFYGTTLLDEAVPVEGEAKFFLNTGQLRIPADDSKTVSIKAVLNPINNAENTNAEIQIKVNDLEIRSSNGALLASYTNSSDLANKMVVRRTKPTFAKVNDITGSQSSVQEVARFTISADAEDVKVDSLSFTKNGTGSASVTEFWLYEGTNLLGTATTSPEFTFSSIVSKNSSKTYRVLANTTGVASEATFGVSLSDIAGTNNFKWFERFGVNWAPLAPGYDSTYVIEEPMDFGSMKY